MTLAAVVLAAGAGRRFGGGKMAALFRGEPLLSHAIRAARAAPVAKVIVVAAHDLPLEEWNDTPPVEVLRVASPALSMSLKTGIAAVADADGAFVFLGDMPLIPPGLAARLATALGDAYAAIPRHEGRNGHPVLLSRRAFADIANLEGDEGAGRLLKTRDDVVFVDSPTAGVLLDIDHADDIARLEARKD